MLSSDGRGSIGVISAACGDTNYSDNRLVQIRARDTEIRDFEINCVLLRSIPLRWLILSCRGKFVDLVSFKKKIVRFVIYALMNKTVEESEIYNYMFFMVEKVINNAIFMKKYFLCYLFIS